jgi:antitoxin CptB
MSGMSAGDEAELRRLRWRCRRGMRELDQLLNRWLDQQWAAASEAQRGVFLRLLACEDDKLWRWFLGHENAPDAALDSLVQGIRALQPSS